MPQIKKPVNKKSSELSEQERRENDAVMRYLQHKEDDQANSKYQTIGGIALEIVKNAEVKREKLLERKPERPAKRKKKPKLGDEEYAGSMGWIKLPRDIMDSPAFADPDAFQILVYCLCSAAHKEQHVPISIGRGIRVVTVPRGSFIFGRHSVAKKLKMSGSKLYRRIKWLKATRHIDVETHSHYSIITICNYDDYQFVKK